jgi:hypothetical protein
MHRIVRIHCRKLYEYLEEYIDCVQASKNIASNAGSVTKWIAY